MEYYNNYDYYYPDYLMHYGVKGMKWGHRKSQAVVDARSAYKQARKDYNKSFNKAYNRSIAAYSPVKKHRQANEDRWVDAVNKAGALKEAKASYKQAKKDDRQARKAERGQAKADKVLAKNTKVKDAVSFKAAGHKAYAKMFEINENYYSKRSSSHAKQMASMNRTAKNQELKKAEEAQRAANAKRRK